MSSFDLKKARVLNGTTVPTCSGLLSPPSDTVTQHRPSSRGPGKEDTTCTTPEKTHDPHTSRNVNLFVKSVNDANYGAAVVASVG